MKNLRKELNDLGYTKSGVKIYVLCDKMEFDNQIFLVVTSVNAMQGRIQELQKEGAECLNWGEIG